VKKKLSVIICTVILLQMVVPFTSSQAAGGISIISDSVVAEYPDKLNFSLSVESDSDITDVRLHYQVDRLCYADVTSEVYIDIYPDTVIEAEWSWDMRKTGGLPPGTVVKYWWTITDASGAGLETQPDILAYYDNRYSWQKIEKDGVTLYWYKGNREFAEALLTAAVEGLERLDENTGVSLSDPIELYIYANSSDLQDAMIFPQTWTGGVAYPQYGCVAIGIEPTNIEWGLRTVVHELTHLVIHQMTYNPYLDLPTWLDEGLAMYMEGPLTSVFIYYLNKAAGEDSLISVRSLASPFSAYADLSYLSYAESHSLVNFLIDTYGQGKMLELLTVLSDGTEYDEAFIEVYDFNIDELNDIWLEYIYEYTGQSYKTGITASDNILALFSPALPSGSL
jgi:hypothetical protein